MTPSLPQPIQPYESIVDHSSPFGPRLFRPLVYAFEHLVGPQMFFSRHPELQRALQPTPTPGDAFIHAWSKSAFECELRGWWPDGLMQDAEAYVKYVAPLVDAVVCQPMQAPDDTVWCLTTPAPQTPAETFYLALCRSADRTDAAASAVQLRYFTLERTHGNQVACLCEWTRHGAHQNLGNVPLQTAEGFVQLVLGHLRG